MAAVFGILGSYLLAALFGLVVGTLFEDPLKIARNQFLEQLSVVGRKIRPRPHSTFSPFEFSLGSQSVGFVVIDGDGILSYTPETIVADYTAGQLSLPSDLQALRDKVESAPGNLWNSQLYGLDSFEVQRTPWDEHIKLVLHFRDTDYFAYLATNGSLDILLPGDELHRTVRQKYAPIPDWTKPLPEFGNALGMVLTLVADGQVMICRRSRFTGFWADRLTISVGEFLSRALDRKDDGLPDIYGCAIRGAREELGIELKPGEITLLSFGVSVAYGEWSLLGLAKVHLPPSYFMEQRARGLNSKFENTEIHFIDWDPRTVLTFMHDHPPWAPGAVVCLYHGLVKDFTRSKVDRMVATIFT